MAIRHSTVIIDSKAKIPNFATTSRMTNYQLFFDETLHQYRCGLYTNKAKDIEFNDRDVIWVIESGYQYRLDLISLKFYETVKYDWLIADANNIEDPIKDIIAGKKIIIPSLLKVR